MKVGATGFMALTLAMMLVAFAPNAFAGPIDSDFDGVDDENDNCPKWFNPLQENHDGDDWGDVCDNCLVAFNGVPDAGPVDQCDTDHDGYGNWCDGDFNQDNVVGVPDFNIFRSCFGMPGAPMFAECDCNCDGVVGVPDFNCFRAQFGAGPGPSGWDCAGSMPGATGYCWPAPFLLH